MKTGRAQLQSRLEKDARFERPQPLRASSRL